MFGLSNKNKHEETYNVGSGKILKILNVVGQLNTELNLDTILQEAADSFVRNLDYNAAAVFLIYGKDTLRSLTVSSTPLVNLAVRLLPKAINTLSVSLTKDTDNLIVKSVNERRLIIGSREADFITPVVAGNVADQMQSMLGIKQLVAFPLIDKGTPIGAMLLSSTTDGQLEKDKEIIQSFSTAIGVAINNASLYTQSQRQLAIITARNHELSSLYNLTNKISQTLDPEKVAQIAVDSLPQDEEMIGAILSVFDKEKDEITVKALTHNQISEKAHQILGGFSKYIVKPKDPAFANSPTVKAIFNNQPYYTEDIQSVFSPPIPPTLIPAISKLLNATMVIIHPLKARNEIVGSISYVLRGTKVQDLDDNQKQLFYTYSLQIGIALENANLYSESQTIQKELQSALQQLQEARRAEKDMMDVMGHELRTPISIVRNSLAVLNKQLERNANLSKEEIDKYVDMALESTRREINLIETLLSATKIDASRMQIYQTKVDLLDVVNDGIEGQRDAVAKKNIHTRYSAINEQILIYADRTRMQEVVDNLYSNAIKYTLKGNVEIRVWKDDKAGYVSVLDTGMGISPEDLQNLGKKFFRARQYIPNPENKPGEKPKESVVRPGGTGLGLYVIFDLVRIMEGTLYINSEVGKGSNFTVSMPLYTNQPDKQIDQTFLGTKEVKTRDHIILNSPNIPQPPANLESKIISSEPADITHRT